MDNEQALAQCEQDRENAKTNIPPDAECDEEDNQ